MNLKCPHLPPSGLHGTGAECDQGLFGVVARVAAELFVVDLKMRHCAAGLTPPAIAALHLLPQTLVRHRIPLVYLVARNILATWM
jgi:hypothetical protein